jgi:hypothetical protein
VPKTVFRTCLLCIKFCRYSECTKAPTFLDIFQIILFTRRNRSLPCLITHLYRLIACLDRCKYRYIRITDLPVLHWINSLSIKLQSFIFLLLAVVQPRVYESTVSRNWVKGSILKMERTCRHGKYNLNMLFLSAWSVLYVFYSMNCLYLW